VSPALLAGRLLAELAVSIVFFALLAAAFVGAVRLARRVTGDDRGDDAGRRDGRP
jgi:hypothetical protein